MKKILSFLLSIVLIFGLLPTVQAAGVVQNIDVKVGGISLYLDGELQTPKDAKGNTVQPIIWNGTTYLPVRALTNMLTDKTVNWDGATNSVYLGNAPAADRTLALVPDVSLYLNMAGQEELYGTSVTLYPPAECKEQLKTELVKLFSQERYQMESDGWLHGKTYAWHYFKYTGLAEVGTAYKSNHVELSFGPTRDDGTFKLEVNVGKGFALVDPGSRTGIAALQSKTEPAAAPATPVAAGQQRIQAKVGGISIYLDGKLQVPTDANGNTVQPIIWNGTTYLPVRALTNMLTDKQVFWQGDTKRIYLGELSEQDYAQFAGIPDLGAFLKLEPAVESYGTGFQYLEYLCTGKDIDALEKEILALMEQDAYYLTFTRQAGENFYYRYTGGVPDVKDPGGLGRINDYVEVTIQLYEDHFEIHYAYANGLVLVDPGSRTKQKLTAYERPREVHGSGDSSGSGSSSSSGDEDCSWCSGGRCRSCGGSGKERNWLAGTREYVTQSCSDCHGTGRCSWCHGTGKR